MQHICYQRSNLPRNWLLTPCLECLERYGMNAMDAFCRSLWKFCMLLSNFLEINDRQINIWVLFTNGGSWKIESLWVKVNLAQSKNAAIWSQRFHELLTWRFSDGHIYNYLCASKKFLVLFLIWNQSFF